MSDSIPELSVKTLISKLKNSSTQTTSTILDIEQSNAEKCRITEKRIKQKAYMSAVDHASKITSHKKFFYLLWLYRKATELMDIELLVSVCEKLSIKIPLNLVCVFFREKLSNHDDSVLENILKPLKYSEKCYILYTTLNEELNKTTRDSMVAIMINNLFDEIETENKQNTPVQEQDNYKQNNGGKRDDWQKGKENRRNNN